MWTVNEAKEVIKRLREAGWEVGPGAPPAERSLNFLVGPGARFYLDTGGPAGIVSIRLYAVGCGASERVWFDLGWTAHDWGGQAAGTIPSHHIGNLRWALNEPLTRGSF